MRHASTAVWGATSLIMHCLVLGADNASKGGGSVGFVIVSGRMRFSKGMSGASMRCFDMANFEFTKVDTMWVERATGLFPAAQLVLALRKDPGMRRGSVHPHTTLTRRRKYEYS